MKKIISLMCLVLTFATLFCACNGDEPIETQPVTEAVTTTESAFETTSAPKVEKPTPYVDFEGTVNATSTKISALTIRAFIEKTEYNGKTYDIYYKNAQGGCIMGDYLITCMHAWADDEGKYPQMICIVKSELKTGKIVAKSKGMPLGHGNDATYNPDDNVIVIAACDSNYYNKLFIIDPETLELKDTKTVSGIGTTICAIDYDTLNKRYVTVGISNDYVHIYDRKFQLIKEFKGYGMSKGSTYGYSNEFSEQGIKTDGIYLYILEWHGGSKWPGGTIVWDEVKSNILVTDLSTGEHVATIDTGIGRELEFMVYRNGKLYIGCNNEFWTGMEFYRVDITTTKN